MRIQRILVSMLFLILFSASLRAQVSLSCSSTYKPDPNDTHGETCPFEGGTCSYLLSAHVADFQAPNGVVTLVHLHVDAGNYYDIITQAVIAPFSRSASSLSLQAFTIPGPDVGQAADVNVASGAYDYDNVTRIITVTSSGIIH